MKKMLRMIMAMAMLVVFNVDAFSQIRINEIGTNGVDYENASKWVELYNAGESEVDVSGLILCDFPEYPALGDLTALGGGSTTIPAGGYLVVAWSALDNDNDGDAEVGLYVASTSDFGDAGSMTDYMQYGTASHFREGTAQAAGVWTVGDFVEAAPSGMSLQYVDNGTPGSGNWIAAEPTPNGANPTPLSSIRISEVGFDGVDYEGAGIWVELFNASDASVDVSNLILCDFPRYPAINSLTALGGTSTTIPAGGYLVVAWPDLGDGNAHAEVGLYKEGSAGAFGEASNLLDYMQFGEAAHRREGTAEEAGLWTVGSFVPAAASGMSLQLVDDASTGSTNWVERPATPNMANGLSTANEENEVPAGFALHNNFPNPFNPTTSISYDLSTAGQVALDVYDTLGQRITSLFSGGQPAGSYTISWDGRDARGNVVSSGVYLYRLTLDGQASQTRVMTLLK